MNYVDCLGIKVKKLQLNEFFIWINEKLAKNSDKCDTMYLVNAHTLNLAWKNAQYKKVLNDASLVLNDGIGLDICSKIQKNAFAYNFNGTDLFPTLFDYYQINNKEIKLYLYGAKPGVADSAAQHIMQKWPMIKVVGTNNGYIKNNAEVLEAINKARADILLVALGNPMQEFWISNNLANLNCKLAVGIGALFDFLSGNVARAPTWMRSIHCEWLYRLLLEPRRMFLRYVIGIPLFFVHMLQYGLTPKAK